MSDEVELPANWFSPSACEGDIGIDIRVGRELCSRLASPVPFSEINRERNVELGLIKRETAQQTARRGKKSGCDFSRAWFRKGRRKLRNSQNFSDLCDERALDGNL